MTLPFVFRQPISPSAYSAGIRAPEPGPLYAGPVPRGCLSCAALVAARRPDSGHPGGSWGTGDMTEDMAGDMAGDMAVNGERGSICGHHGRTLKPTNV
jgi:hypothetical protein